MFTLSAMHTADADAIQQYCRVASRRRRQCILALIKKLHYQTNHSRCAECCVDFGPGNGSSTATNVVVVVVVVVVGVLVIIFSKY